MKDVLEVDPANYAGIMAMNKRLAQRVLDLELSTKSAGSFAGPLTWMAIGCCVVTVGAVAGIILFEAPANRPAEIASICGVLGPIIFALVAAAVREIHKAVNSQYTQFVATIARASRAEGRLDAATRLVDNNEPLL